MTWACAHVVASWSSGTTSRMSAAEAGSKTAAPLLSIAATTSSCGYVTPCQIAASGIVATTKNRAASTVIISDRRSNRSASWPPGSRQTARRISQTEATRPAWAALPPMLSTSSG